MFLAFLWGGGRVWNVYLYLEEERETHTHTLIYMQADNYVEIKNLSCALQVLILQ